MNNSEITYKNSWKQYISKEQFDKFDIDSQEDISDILSSNLAPAKKEKNIARKLKKMDLYNQQNNQIIELKQENTKMKEQAHKQSSSGGKADAKNFNGISIHKYQRQFLCILYIHLAKFRCLADSTMTIRFSRESIQKAIRWGIECNFLDEQEDLGSMYSYGGDWGITDNRIGSFYQGIGSLGFEAKFSKDKKKSIEGSEYVYSYSFQLLTNTRALNITAKKTKSDGAIQIDRREYILANIEKAFVLKEGKIDPDLVGTFIDGMFDR